MSVADYQTAVLDRLDAGLVLGLSFACAVLLLLTFVAVSGIGRR